MKKTLIVAVILAVVVAVLFYLFWPRVPREQQVCEKLVALCGIEKVSAQTCTEGLVRTKKMLGDRLATAEDCVLQAKTCAIATVCMADKGLRAVTPFVEGLLTQSVESGKEALTQKVKQATETVTAAQKKVREQIAAEISAAEAQVEAAHTSARKWVSDTIDSVGQTAKGVGDTVARHARRILGGKEADAGPADKNQDPVKALEEKLAQAKNLISSERFDEARTLLRDLSWLGADTKRDEKMAAYYKAMRDALLKIIDRRQ